MKFKFGKVIMLSIAMFLSLILFGIKINAYTCTYEDARFEIEYSDSGLALSAHSTIDPSGSTYSYSLSDGMKTTSASKPGECANVQRCITLRSNDPLFIQYTLFNDSIDYEQHKSECQGTVEGIIFKALTGNDDSKPVDDPSKDGNNKTCPTFDNIFNNELIPAYKSCNNRACPAYQQEKSRLKDLCSAVLDNNSYDDMCLKNCLKLNERIMSEIENKKLSLNSCGISNKLVVWLINIIKWVKYIIPVIVILLGILDFIRAVMGDKDDDMKKAQGRFVRRLIAAALIFIVPFILEFILEKMGFNVQDCGLKLF